MFSVLMSVYSKDNPAFLKESIDSLLSQSVKADEILIVKDGPLTSELEAVLDVYKDPAIRYLSFEKNQGLAKALRAGVLECRHELIARMDSDDVCHPDRFKYQLRAFEEDPSIDVVGTSIIEFDKTIADASKVRRPPSSGKSLLCFSKRRSPTNHASVMYRKSAVLRAGNYQDFLWNEDYHLWARMIKSGAVFKNLDIPLLYVRGGDAMYIRRGGLKYAIQDLKLQVFFFKIGFVNLWEMVTNSLIRLPIRVAPNFMRKLIYEHFLRF